ncbi:MAG: hypothetical protein KC491_11260, partial [Dehalococcoidia bacterium]|nr:hypothetical protein [Dehalococcoidia bacterium]
MRHLPPAKPSVPTWTLLKRVARLFAPFRGRMAALAILIIVTSTLDLLPALFMAAITNEAAKQDLGDGSRITLLFVLAVSIYLVSGTLGVGRSYLNQWIGQGVMVNL